MWFLPTNGKVVDVIRADSVLGLNGKWNTAEFNLFGDLGRTEAIFNSPGATINVQLHVSNGSTASPTCVLTGTTGETSNVNLVTGSCCPVGGANPAISFTETNASGIKASFCLLNDLSPVTSLLV